MAQHNARFMGFIIVRGGRRESQEEDLARLTIKLVVLLLLLLPLTIAFAIFVGGFVIAGVFHLSLLEGLLLQTRGTTYYLLKVMKKPRRIRSGQEA